MPGTVGGCVKMNAGGTFGDIGNAVEVVHVMNHDGEIFTRHRADLVFAYRSTNINAPFILGAEFSLTEDDPYQVLRQVKQIWIQKKNTQPLASGSCGCVFRNPRGMSAGAIIDHVGLKGHRVGGAYVSERHANFILADPGAKAADMLELIRVVRETVEDQAGVRLELELEVW
jgi:UDP-N-acetylmuramate dehydrogenase